MGRIPDWTPVYYTPEQVKVGFIYTADFRDLSVTTNTRKISVLLRFCMNKYMIILI